MGYETVVMAQPTPNSSRNAPMKATPEAAMLRIPMPPMTQPMQMRVLLRVPSLSYIRPVSSLPTAIRPRLQELTIADTS